MAWKGDEIWMFEHSRAAATGGPWPVVGMPSSVGVVNPGLSTWLFIAIAYVAASPVAMVIAVQVLNVLTLWGLYAFIAFAMPERARQPWLWGLILVSVSPLPIMFSRKIWAQDLLPAFSLLVLIGHWYRARAWGGFLWGLAGALIGQIHMSGFFLAGSLAGWTIARDRKSARWVPWLIGGAIGAVGVIPWVVQVLEHDGPEGRPWIEALTLRFYTRWIATALGLNLPRTMGSEFWTGFLREPVVAGVPTYLVALAHVFLVIVGLTIVVRWFRRESREAYRALLDRFPDIRFYLEVTLVGVGLSMTLSRFLISAHHLIVLIPFVHIWLAMKLHGRTRTLIAVAVAQLLISVSFLAYVHQHGGVPGGDYGTSFRQQVR